MKPIITNNCYHSPEVSDEENENSIKVQNLRWRSSTVGVNLLNLFIEMSNTCTDVRQFIIIIFFKKTKKLRNMFFYLDKNAKRGLVKRNQIYDKDNYANETVPPNAPDWTISGYNGPLKNLVKEACIRLNNEE